MVTILIVLHVWLVCLLNTFEFIYYKKTNPTALGAAVVDLHDAQVN